MEEMYCIKCHGRGLDSNDKICDRCQGTGFEPEFEPIAETCGPEADHIPAVSFSVQLVS